MARRVLILTRDLGISDIPLLRYMQKTPEQTVYRLTNDQERYEFVVQLTNDIGNANGFKDYTTNGMTGLTPSTYYAKLCKNDPAIQSFYMATLSEGKFSKIERVTSKGLTDLTRGRMEEPLD